MKAGQLRMEVALAVVARAKSPEKASRVAAVVADLVGLPAAQSIDRYRPDEEASLWRMEFQAVLPCQHLVGDSIERCFRLARH